MANEGLEVFPVCLKVLRQVARSQYLDLTLTSDCLLTQSGEEAPFGGGGHVAS